MIALFIGRFQPLHLGHLDALKQIAKDFDKIIVGVGSAQVSGTAKNPYNYEIRKEMVESIKDQVDAEISILPIPDIDDDENWVSYVKEIVGDFHTVFSGNTWVLGLFNNKDIPTQTQDFNIKISATDIRDKLQKGDIVKSLIPASVYEIIEKQNA